MPYLELAPQIQPDRNIIQTFILWSMALAHGPALGSALGSQPVMDMELFYLTTLHKLHGRRDKCDEDVIEIE